MFGSASTAVGVDLGSTRVRLGLLTEFGNIAVFSDPTLDKTQLAPYLITEDGKSKTFSSLEKTMEGLKRQVGWVTNTMDLPRTLGTLVASVPDPFGWKERQDLERTLKATGIANAVRFLNPATAVGYTLACQDASATSATQSPESDTLYVVLDVGATTTNVSILKARPFEEHVEVMAMGGDASLGRVDIDFLMFAYVWKRIQIQKLSNPSVLFDHPDVFLSFFASWGKAINSFLRQDNTKEVVIGIQEGPTSPKIALRVTRAEFQEVIAPIFLRLTNLMKTIVERMLNIKKDDVDLDVEIGKKDVIFVLAGGCFSLQNSFGQDLAGRLKNIFTSVCKDWILDWKTSRQVSDDMVVKGLTCYANMKQQVFPVFECGKIKPLELWDVTPFSFGIQVSSGAFIPVLPQGTPVLTRKTKLFTTQTRGQKHVWFRIYAGNNPLAKDNAFLVTRKISRNLLAKVNTKNEQRTFQAIFYLCEDSFQLAFIVVDKLTGERLSTKIGFENNHPQKEEENQGFLKYAPVLVDETDLRNQQEMEGLL